MSINITSAHHPIVYVPVLGSVISLVHLFNKCVIMPCLSRARVQNSHYFSWLKEESGFRLVGLMIPLWGAALVWLYDFVMKEEAIMNARYGGFNAIAPWLKNNMDVVKAACAATPEKIQYVDDDVALRYMRDMMQNDPQKFDAAFPHLKETVRQTLVNDTGLLSSFIYRTPQLMQLVTDDVALPFMSQRIANDAGEFLRVEPHLSEEVKTALVNEVVLRASFDTKPEIIKYATDELATRFMKEKMEVNQDVFWIAENHLSKGVKTDLVTKEFLSSSFGEKPQIIKYETDEIALEFMQEKMQEDPNVFWIAENHLSKEVKKALVTKEVLEKSFDDKPEIIKYATDELALEFMKEKMQNDAKAFLIFYENYLSEGVKTELVTEEVLGKAFELNQFEIIKYAADELALLFMQEKMQNDSEVFLSFEKDLRDEVRAALVTREVLENLFTTKPQIIKYAEDEVALEFMQKKMSEGVKVFLIAEHELSKDVKEKLVTKEVLGDLFDAKPHIIEYVTGEMALQFMQAQMQIDSKAFWIAENHLSEEVKKELVQEVILENLFTDKPQIIKYATDEIAEEFLNNKMEEDGNVIWSAADYLSNEVRAKFKLNDVEYAREVIKLNPDRLKYFDKEVVLVLIQENMRRVNDVPIALLGAMGILQEITKEKLPRESVGVTGDYYGSSLSVQIRLELIRNNPTLVLKELASLLANQISYPKSSEVTFLNLDGSNMQGSDAGGLSRTFFSEMGEAIKPLLVPFKIKQVDTQMLVGNKMKVVKKPIEEKVEVEDQVYSALGYLMGVAFLNKTPTGCLFSPDVYNLLVAIRDKNGIFQAYQTLWKSNELDPLEREKMRLVNLSFEVIDLLKNLIEKPNLEGEIDFDDLSDKDNVYFNQIETFATFLYARIKNNKPDWWGENAVPDIEILYEHGDWIIEQVKSLNLNQKTIENNIVEGVKKGKFGLIATGIFDPKIRDSETLRNVNAENLRLNVEGSQVSAEGMKNLFNINNRTVRGWMHRWFDEHKDNTEMLKLFLWAATGSKSIINFSRTPSCSDYASGGCFKFATCSFSCYVNVDAIETLGGLGEGVIEDREIKEKESRYLFFKENLERDLVKLDTEGFNVL